MESEGRPALVTILGNAGVGKSRLAWEFTKYVEGLPQILYWRKGRSLAYGNVSYSALAEAVKAQCEILGDDAPEVVAEKVDRAVEELFGDLEVAPQVRALVGARSDQRFGREELFDAWRRFLERLASRYPLVLALEDIHWADAGLLDFVDHLADWASGPILILTLARPELLEVRPAWGGGKRNYSAIYLEPLSAEECEAMVEDLLSPTLPLEVKRLVSERSEGNPLYAEEIVRMLIDRGVLRATEASLWELAQPLAEVEVPRSIHALIAARLDTLPSEEKRVLQDAAVAGRIFWLGAAAQLSERSAEEVRDALGRLRVKEIVTPREPSTFSGDLEFAFRHVLIRDVAYESLPKLLRATKHVDVARWAEERAGERSEELAEVVGAHYLQAIEYREELGEPQDRGLDRAGAAWAWEAGRRASSLLQQEAALRWFTASLRLAERSEADEDWLAQITAAVATSADGLWPYEQVAVALRTALDRFEALGMDAEAGRTQVALGYLAFQGGDHARAKSWLERGIARLEPFGDGPELARGLEMLGNYHRRRGELREAESLLRRSAEIASRVGARVVEGQAAASLASALLHLGRVKEGLATIERAYEIAMEAGDLELELRVSNALPSALMDYEPDYERGRRVLVAGIELSQRSGRRDFESWIWSNVANYAFDQGLIDEMEHAGRMCLEIGAALAQPYGTSAGNLSLGQAAFLRGELNAARRHADASIEAMDRHEEVQGAPYQTMLLGWIARARGDEEEALRWFLDGLDIVGDRSMLGMADELLSETIRTLVRMGRLDEVAPYLEGLRIVAEGRPNAEGQQWWAEGIVETDPAAREAKLTAAVERFRWLTRRLDEARCLLDLAEAGVERTANVERARALFADCGAEVYLREIDAPT